MPRYPNFSGGGFAQVAERSQDRAEDRKARKAALKQSLVNTGVGIGGTLLNTGVDVFKNVYAHDQAKQRQQAQQAFSEKILERQNELQNPMVNVPGTPPDFMGPPPQDRLNTITKLGHLKVAENNATDNNYMQKLMAAKIFGDREAVSNIPEFTRLPYSDQQGVKAGNNPELQKRLDLSSQVRNILTRTTGHEGFDTEQDSAKRRELLARAIGAGIQGGASNEAIQALLSSQPELPPESSAPASAGTLPQRFRDLMDVGFYDMGRSKSDPPRHVFTDDLAGQAVEMLLGRFRPGAQYQSHPPLTAIERQYLERFVQPK